MNNFKLSIVIPAYNESKNLRAGVFKEVENYLRKVSFLYEVVIVDDGSVDDTVSIIKKQIRGKKGFRLIESPHGGKALAVITGLLEARGEVALFTDVDQATPLKEVEKFFPQFKEGYEVVIGSRQGRKGAPLIRKLAAWGFATLRNLILGLPFVDTQCGFKAFNKTAREAIFPKLKEEWNRIKSRGAAVNAGFDVEALFLAKRYGFRVAEVPVDWHHVGTERVQIIKDSVDGLKDILRIKWNDLRGKY